MSSNRQIIAKRKRELLVHRIRNLVYHSNRLIYHQAQRCKLIMDTGADITDLLTEAMNDPDVPDLFADQQRALLLRIRDACDERWMIMTTNLMIQDRLNHDYIYEFYLDASKALHDELHDMNVTNCEVADSSYFDSTIHANVLSPAGQFSNNL